MAKHSPSPPDPEETTRFWPDLSGVPVQHDDSKEWIKEVEEKLQKKVQRQADITISKRDVKKQLETRFRIGNLLGQMAFNLTVKVEMLLKPTCANCKAFE